MSGSGDSGDIFEYVPMSAPYSKIGLGYRFSEGIGPNVSGGLRGYVTIHAHSPNQVDVSVFSDTGVRKLAPNSWRQAVVKLCRGDQVLATKVVNKNEPYIVSEQSRDLYLGSAKLDLPQPVDATPLQVTITVTTTGIFPEGVAPGKIQHAVIPISVRKVIRP